MSGRLSSCHYRRFQRCIRHVVILLMLLVSLNLAFLSVSSVSLTYFLSNLFSRPWNMIVVVQKYQDKVLGTSDESNADNGNPRDFDTQEELRFLGPVNLHTTRSKHFDQEWQSEFVDLPVIFGLGLKSINRTKISLQSQARNIARFKDISQRKILSQRLKFADITGSENTLPDYFARYLWPPRSKQQQKATLQNKIIFYYNIPSWVKVGKNFAGCFVDACALTTDEKQLSKADAVMVHAVRLTEHDTPPARSPGQIWIAYGLEPPSHYYLGYTAPAWRDVFNWTMTYRRDSDIFYPYSSLKLAPESKGKNYTDIALKKSRSAAWIVSNCNTDSRRDVYVQQMQKHGFSVDVYGRCGPHRCERNSSACQVKLNTAYRFYLSFENSFCHDYVTEKLFKIYDNTDAIPIVRGGLEYKKYFPPGTFIDTADFKSPAELVSFLKSLESNTLVYATMLKKKDRYRSVWPHGVMCNLCEMLHSKIEEKTYPDFPRWLNDGMCWDPTDIYSE